MSNRKRGKGVRLKPRITQAQSEEVGEVFPPPKDIYESVVAKMGFDPLKEKAARRT